MQNLVLLMKPTSFLGNAFAHRGGVLIWNGVCVCGVGVSTIAHERNPIQRLMFCFPGTEVNALEATSYVHLVHEVVISAVSGILRAIKMKSLRLYLTFRVPVKTPWQANKKEELVKEQLLFYPPYLSILFIIKQLKLGWVAPLQKCHSSRGKFSHIISHEQDRISLKRVEALQVQSSKTKWTEHETDTTPSLFMSVYCQSSGNQLDFPS